MPIRHFVDRSTCVHSNVHPKWINKDGVYAVCQMAKPHLINSIKLLENTLNEIYPLQYTAGRLNPVHAKEISKTEYDLKMLLAELDRREFWR